MPKRRGNAGLWEARKTKLRFPSLPTTLGNRYDSHIPTAPTIAALSQKPNPERSPDLSAFTAPLQAHPSMRKCSGPRETPTFLFRDPLASGGVQKVSGEMDDHLRSGRTRNDRIASHSVTGQRLVFRWTPLSQVALFADLRRICHEPP